MPSVCPSVRLFVTYYKKLSISFTFEDMVTKFAHNVYAYKHMSLINFGLILKNKKAATNMFQFFPHVPVPLSLAVLQPQFSTFQEK